MPKATNTPAFPEGSTVRDRVTGKTYTVAQSSTVGNSSGYWTTVILPQPDDDGCRVMMLPTDELDADEVTTTHVDPERHFTAAVKFADGYDTIQARVTDSGDFELGYRLDFEGYENDVDGAQPFYIDRRHLGDFVALLQRVTDSL